MSISLDGCTSGDSRAPDADAAPPKLGRQRGAVVMGLNMFGPIRDGTEQP